MRIERKDIASMACPLIFMSSAYFAGSKRCIKYFPGCSMNDLIAMSVTGSCLVLGSRVFFEEPDAIVFLTIYGLAFAIIVAWEKGFIGHRKFYSFQLATFGAIELSSLFIKRVFQRPDDQPVRLPDPHLERPDDQPVRLPEPLLERPDEQPPENQNPIFKGIASQNIFSHFDASDIEKISLVSRSWKSLSRDNKELALECLTISDLSFAHFSDRLKNDFNFVLAAVGTNTHALQYASDRLKDDPQIVLASVNTDACSLQHASSRLKDDRDIVLAAVNNDGRSFLYASERLRDDREVALAAMNKFDNPLRGLSVRLMDDREFALAAVNKSAHSLRYMSVRLGDDRDVVLAAINQSYFGLSCASKRLRDDRDVVLAAIRKSRSAIEYASPRLRANKALQQIAQAMPR